MTENGLEGIKVGRPVGGAVVVGLTLIIWIVGVSGCSVLRSTQDGFANLISPGKSKGKSANKARHLGSGSRDEFDFGRTDPNRLMLSDLAPGQIATTVRTRFSSEDRSIAEDRFRNAHELYNLAISDWEQDAQSETAAKLFKQAANEFKLAGANWRDSALEQDSLFMIAECHFFVHQYAQANRAYEQLVAKYPGTQHMDTVQSRRFTIAKYWIDLSREQSAWNVGINLTDDKRPLLDMTGHARRILHSIRLDDPTGRVADDATMALANAHFEAGKYEDAADTYEDLRRTYPGSRHQFQAHMLELKARMISYRGADYDGTQLVKADKVLNAMVTQFPQNVREHREYLDQEAGRIRTLLAERDFSIGKYFEKRGENRAAGIYYESVAKNFGETDLAETAIARRDDLADEPAVPQQRAAWLVNLFPEPKSTKPLIGPGNGNSLMR